MRNKLHRPKLPMMMLPCKISSTRADDLISRAEAAEIPGDTDARIDVFFDLDSEFNALELEIDTYEDQKEGECRSGSLSWDDYRTLESAA